MAGGRRMLKDTTVSEKVNKLSYAAEVFFYRLIMKADDFGNYSGNVKILRANLYPLRSDSIREADMTRWIAECDKSGLIVLYQVEEKPYLHIVDFGQKLKRMKSVYPPPDQYVRPPVPGFVPEGEEESEEEKKQNTNIEVPALDVFMSYAKENIKDDFDSLKKSIELKYKSWVANDWKTGKGRLIKNWKSTLLNTIPYLEKEKNYEKKENGNKTATGSKAESYTEGAISLLDKRGIGRTDQSEPATAI